VNVESVAWIAQRKTILAMLFFLPALFYYLRFDRTDRRLPYVLSVILFVLAMLSKGSVVGLPVVILLCVWWLRGTISKRDIIRSIPFFAVSAVMSVVEIWFQYNRTICEDVVRSDSFLSRLAGAGWAVWFYLYKAILPINLTFIYPRWHIDAANRVSYVPGLLLIVLLMLTWRYRRGWGRPAFFAFVYFVVMLFPVLGFFNIYFMRYAFVADHYQYVSIISVIALATGIVYRYLGAGVLRIAAILVLMLLGSATWQQSSRYKNAETLWKDTLRKTPNCVMAHNNLGNILQFQGKIDAAVSHFYQAINKDPNFFEAYNNLGNALLLQGKADEAVFYYSRSLELNPANARIHYNLATVLQSQGRSEEAVKHYIEALRFKPDFVDARSNLGVLFAGVGKFDDAIVNFTEALRMKPNSAELHYNLAIALDSQGRSEEALAHYNRALELASAENNQQLINQIHKKLESYGQPEQN
jgi:tetratricopeptide (TPR) repeat protein